MDNDDDSQIPNFLMLDQIPANYTQQLETDLLEPVVFIKKNVMTLPKLHE